MGRPARDGEQTPVEEVDRSASLWELLNIDPLVDVRLLRIAFVIFFLTYLTVVVIRYQPHDELWPRAATLAYAGFAATFAHRFSAVTIRCYTIGLAVVLPVLTARVSSVSDPGMLGVVMVGVMAFVSLQFTGRAQDLFISVPLMVVGLLVVDGPSAGLPRSDVLTVWGALILVGTTFCVPQIGHRNRSLLANRLAERNRDEALAAMRQKAAFLAEMSHEIRTPLNGVLGVSELLSHEPMGDGAKRYVNTLRESAHGLLNLLNDILDSSKIEAGHLRLEAAPFDPRRAVEGLAELFQTLADGKGLELRCQVDPMAPVAVIGDETRLRQVLSNLLSNAVKFTEQGHVELRLSVVEAEEGSVGLRYSVTDSGIGIGPDRVEAIFEDYAQADDTITRRYGGTGLGLGIARRLTDLMGSELAVQSQPGEGTSFCFVLRLPLADASATLEDRETSIPPSRALRLLVADDNDVNRTIAMAVLESLGHEVVCVADGEQALQAVEEQGAFDVLLLDLEMPVLDGLQTLERLRKHARADIRAVPVAAMTAHTFEEQRRACLDAGMAGFVTKPLDPVELQRTLEALIVTAPRAAAQ